MLPLTSSSRHLFTSCGKSKEMCTLIIPVRTFSRLAVNLERSGRMLATLKSHLAWKIPAENRGSVEHFKQKIQNPNVMLCRYMAKTKDKVKKGTMKIKIDERELSNHFDLETLYGDFNGVLNNFKKLLVEQASVRTTPNAIEQLKVKYDGSTYTIQDLAEVGKKGGKEIILEMSAFTEAIPAVVDALKNSTLGLNPNQEGSAIIVPIPKVTREHRETLVKGAKAMFNKCRDNIRNVQNKYISKTNNIEGVSEDNIFRLKAQLTELGNKYISEAEGMFKVKEKELLSTE